MALNNHRTHYPLTQPENPFQKIFVDRYEVEGVQVTKVGMENCLLVDIDRAIEILQQIKAEFAPKPEPAPVPAIIPLYDDEPAEMTAVLGPKPDPQNLFKQYRRNLAAESLGEAIKTFKPKPSIIEEPEPPMPKPKRGKSILNLIGVKSKGFTAGGQKHDGTVNHNYNADIVKNQSIRIYGLEPNRCRWDKETKQQINYTLAFDLTFKVGDTAVYGSYNLTYTGKIVKIGEKTVTISKYGDRNVQLDIHTFIRRNYDYDPVKIAEENANYYD